MNILQLKVKVHRIYVFLQGVNPGHHKEIANESQNKQNLFFSLQGVIMKTEILKTEMEDNWENANQEVTFANLSFLNENSY